MLNITEGKEKRPLKIVIYGPEGIGKSSLSAHFPFPLFIDTEGSTSSLDVRRIKCSKSWNELIDVIKEVKKTPNICKTLVIDTADWAEILCTAAVCEKYRKNSISEFPYGYGYVYLQDEFSKLLNLLDELIETGINVVITAHAKPRKFELPEEQGSFDRYEMKLSKQVCPLLKEWCDCLFFCNYKIHVVTSENNSKKAQGGKRVMYTAHTPTYDAKNRFGLAEELDLDFSSIAHLFEPQEANLGEIKPSVPVERNTIVTLRKMIEEAGVSEEDVQKVVTARGHYKEGTKIDEYTDDFITRWIIPNWKKIIEAIKNNEEKESK